MATTRPFIVEYELRQLGRRLPRRVHTSAASNTKKMMIKIVMVICPPER
jgi:hypothetical protein